MSNEGFTFTENASGPRNSILHPQFIHWIQMEIALLQARGFVPGAVILSADTYMRLCLEIGALEIHEMYGLLVFVSTSICGSFEVAPSNLGAADTGSLVELKRGTDD